MNTLIKFLNECKSNRDFYDVIYVDSVIERLEDILKDISEENKKKEENFTCNICGSTNIAWEDCNGTHMYVCEDCPNVQFEFVSDVDLDNAVNRLGGKKMNKIDKLKNFLQKRFPNAQAFNTRNWTGDTMINVYNEDGIQVDYAPDYDYIEIFGITKSQFDKLLNKNGVLKTFKIKEDE